MEKIIVRRVNDLIVKESPRKVVDWSYSGGIVKRISKKWHPIKLEVVKFTLISDNY